jgi:MarR family transcriptional regulator, temperature-dependent positive regulator of motility
MPETRKPAAQEQADVAKGDIVPSQPLSQAPFNLNLSASHLLHRAGQIATDLHVTAFGSNGLTQRQVAVLAALGQADGITQTELVSRTGIDRSTLAEMVARMETKGLMTRVKSPSDSRANCVSLTPTGQAALQDALPKLVQIDRALLERLAKSRRGLLVDLLSKIALPAPQPEKSKSDDATKKSKKKEKRKKEKKKKADKA